MRLPNGRAHRDHATARLVALGLQRSSAVAMVRQVDTWCASSGPEWAVTRLKDLKTAYIHRLNDGDWKPEWVAWSKGAPKGAFRPLFHQPSHKRARRALNALMIYSSYVAPAATKRQVSKFLGSVLSPPPVREELDAEVVASVPMPKTSRKAWSATWDAFPPSPARKSPVFGRSVDQADPASLPGMIREARALGFVDIHPRVFSELREVILTQPWHTLAGESPCIGKISFIQEPGYKLRAVANPNLVVQTALRPLQSVIWDLLREIPEDCTHDQDAGVSAVVGWLNEGRTVHSVDLSDATNVFPLGLQMLLLRRALPDWQDHLDFFYRASTGRWAYQDPFTGLRSEIRWKKGQPLGLAPSFGAFAYGHHFVARLARSRAGGQGDYRIVGDDIVIVGDEMVRQYRLLLDQLGCPVSESKTLSGTVAEFAGKVVTSAGVISTGKWRMASDESFIEVARMLGPRSLAMFRPRQRAVLRQIADLPEFLGGVGWNPGGKPLEDRLDLYFFIESNSLDEEEHTVTRLSWLSEYMWQRQIKPLSRSTSSRPAKRRPYEVPSHRQVVGMLRPLTESISEDESLPGYGPAEASQPHTVLNLRRWERILADYDSTTTAEGHDEERTLSGISSASVVDGDNRDRFYLS